MEKSVLREVHRFWFGELKAPDDIPEDKAEIWFKQSAETDRTIRERFSGHLGEATATDWDLADLTRVEQVALVVLLDQFPRNIFRESGEAFACDAKARAVAAELVAGGLERYYLCERTFVYMPFMHSEDVADHDRCVSLFAGETLSVAPDHKERLRGNLDFACRHRDIIRKFGRFPHRNEVLGRVSTPAEIEFLKDGRGF